MKRILILLLGIGIAGGIAFNVFKAQIGERVFNRVIDQRVGVDASAALSDGLHVFMCGTGSPMPDESRAGPCIGVLAGKKAYVFDVGSGGARNLGSMGFPLDRLGAVYLTHLHSDHVDGLGELLLVSWVGGSRATPTPVRGPAGTLEVVGGFNAAYRIDSTYRVAHHGEAVANPAGFGGAGEEIVLPAGDNAKLTVLEDGDLKITAIRVGHAPVAPAFGYRIDYKGRSVSISGDTIFHAGFVSASEGVDLMLHEALNKDMVSKIGATLGARGNVSGATVFADILDYHASPEDAARAAQGAKADRLVLYHLVPPLPVDMLEAAFLGDARSEFDGKITVGKDGMVFSLPAGSDAIKLQEKF